MRNIIFLMIIPCWLISCGTQKKMKMTRDTLAGIKAQQGREDARLQAISNVSNAKLSNGKIDFHVDTLLRTKLLGYAQRLQVFQRSAASIDSLLKRKRDFRKNYKNYVRPLLDTLIQINDQYSKRTKLYAMLEDGLGLADYRLFELAAFFGPGKYTIPEDKIDMSLKAFAPIVDSMMLFAEKYKNVPKTGTLIILGFADATGFSGEGALLDSIRAEIGKPDMTKETLNEKLSEMRAMELVKQLRKAFSDKASQYNNYLNIHVEFIAEGKGEMLPLPYIKDYTVDDPRRRIVLCYWTVLPD